MQQVATYETVINACEQLQHNGQKVTGRAVVGITGGSLGTVLNHIKQWRQDVSSNSPAASHAEIPADLQASILRALTTAQEQAKEKLATETEQAAAREAEALEGLAAAEKHILQLVAQGEDTLQQLTETKQAADTAAAIAGEKIATLQARVESLEIERRQLIESAEIARTEAAKAMLQIERADQATVKAENRLQDVEVQFAAIQQQKAEAEKKAALAEQKNQLQADTLAETTMKAETRLQEIEAQFAAIQQQKGEADKRAALAEQKNDIQAELLADIRSSLAELKKEKAEIIREKNQKIAGLEKQITKAT